MKFTSKGIAALATTGSEYKKFCSARRCGFGVSVSAKGKKSWVVRYEDPTRLDSRGKPKRPITKIGDVQFMTLKEATTIAEQVQREKSAEALSMQIHRNQKSVVGWTLREAYEHWLQQITEVTKLASAPGQNKLILKHTPAFWWDLQLTDFNKQLLTPVIKSLQARYASADVQYQSSMRQIFEIAREFGYFPDDRINPLTGIKWKPSRLRPKRLEVLTHEQMRFAWSYEWPCFVRSRGPVYSEEEYNSDDFARAMRFMLLTGQRANEIRRMRWEQIIQWKGFTIWSMPEGYIRKHKTPRAHAIPLMPEALAILGPRKPTGFVFPIVSNFNQTQWTGRVKTRQDMAGVAHRFKAHDIRTTFMTTCIDELDQDSVKVDLCVSHTPEGLSRAAANYMKGQFIPAKCKIYEAWTKHLMEIVTSATHETGASVRTLSGLKRAV